MSEEIKHEQLAETIIEGVKDTDTSVEEVKVNKHEELALAKGWKPKSEFSGDEEDFVEAKEFLKRQELFDHIHKLSRKDKIREKAMKELMAHYKNVEQMTYKQAMTDLEKRQKEAVRLGDEAAVTRVTDEIVQMKQQQLQQPVEVNEEAQEAAHDFIERNSIWYNADSPENTAMKVYADKKDVEIASMYPNLPPDEALKLVESEVKKAFPERFKKSKPVSTVASSEGVASVSYNKKYSFSDLPKDHRDLARVWLEQDKNFDVDQYYRRSKELGVF